MHISDDDWTSVVTRRGKRSDNNDDDVIDKRKHDKMVAAGRMGYAVPPEKLRVIKVLRRMANKPCPCGSGRKTKRCHGRLA